MSLRSGPWYEPASLWSAAYLSGVGLTTIQARFNKQHLRNGTRWPIVIERVAMCGINYGFDIIGSAADFGAYGAAGAGGSAVLYSGKLRLGLPFRKNLSRYEINLSNYRPKPTGQPQGSVPPDSSLWGASYLKFGRPMVLPRLGSVELGLTSLCSMGLGPQGGAILSFSRDDITGYAYYHQSGGLFSGSARIKKLTLATDTAITPLVPDPYTGVPFPRPPAYSIPPYIATSPSLWNGKTAMSARDFEQQEATRSGSTEMNGVGVFLDQIDYDNDVKTNDPLVGATDYKISQLSTRVGIRMRAAHSPSGNWWWRPGAPLALVFDTLTPAVVYELPEPITIAPGDAISASLTLPGANAGTGSTPQGWQVGMSLNGYTLIEG